MPLYIDAPARSTDAWVTNRFHFVTQRPPFLIKRPALGLFCVLFDGVSSEVLNNNVRVTQHTADAKVPVADHAQRMPKKLDVSAWISTRQELDNQQVERLPDALPGVELFIFPPPADENTNRRGNVRYALEKCIGELCDVFTIKYGVLESYALERYRVISSTSNKMQVELTFTEVRQVRADRLVIPTVPAAQKQADPETEGGILGRLLGPLGDQDILAAILDFDLGDADYSTRPTDYVTRPTEPTTVAAGAFEIVR